jgi:hypothetical protein
VEIYVTSGDTIYITEAEKTFFNSSIVTSIDHDASQDNSADDDTNERRGQSTHHHRKQVGLRDPTVQGTQRQQINSFKENPQAVAHFPSPDPPRPSPASPVPAHMEKYQIDLPTISLESYPHMSSQTSTTPLGDLKQSSSPVFHDPLLNPPPNKVNEWPCGLMILVPLRLGLDTVNPMYYEVSSSSSLRFAICDKDQGIKEILQNEYCVGIIGGRPNHAIYFAGYRDNHLLGLDPHTVFTNPSLRDPFPSDEHLEQVPLLSLSVSISHRWTDAPVNLRNAFFPQLRSIFGDRILLSDER